MRKHHEPTALREFGEPDFRCRGPRSVAWGARVRLVEPGPEGSNLTSFWGGLAGSLKLTEDSDRSCGWAGLGPRGLGPASVALRLA